MALASPPLMVRIPLSTPILDVGIIRTRTPIHIRTTTDTHTRTPTHHITIPMLTQAPSCPSTRHNDDVTAGPSRGF